MRGEIATTYFNLVEFESGGNGLESGRKSGRESGRESVIDGVLECANVQLFKPDFVKPEYSAGDRGRVRLPLQFGRRRACTTAGDPGLH